MKPIQKLLTVVAVMALGGAGYAISAAGGSSVEAPSAPKASCCSAKKAARAGGSTAGCQKGASAAAETVANRTPEGQEVTLRGRVLCEHCDLHMAAACAPALKAEGRDGYLRICSTSKGIPEMQKAGDVEVTGYVRPGPDGKDEIEVISFNKRPEKT
jgi:hypothetical protein